MLAALLLNLSTGSTGKPGPDRSDADGKAFDERIYWLLRRQAQERAGKRRAALVAEQVAEQAAAAKAAQAAFQAAQRGNPKLAAQVARPHAVRIEGLGRPQVDFDRLARDAVAMEYLRRLRLEIEDEEALILLLASDSL